QDAAARDKLAQRLPEVQFDATPFTDVFDFFRQRTDLNIYVDWPALRRAGVDRKAQVTAKLRDIQFAKALELIFKSVEGEEDDRKLGYAISDGVVTITTRRELNKN